VPLGPGFRRYAALVESEVARMRGRQAARTAGHDDVRIDAASGVVTYTRGAQLLWIAQSERLGAFSEDVGLLRWWWQGTIGGPTKRSRLDAVFAEGQRLRFDELTTGAVAVDDLEAAEMVCGVAANIARADGVEVLREGDQWAFYALFEADASKLQLTIPPPRPTSRPAPPAARRAVQSIPPPADASGTLFPPPPAMPRIDPGTSPAGVQPGREAFTPVAQEAASVVYRTLETFTQALLTVTVDRQPDKTRFFVHLAAADGSGDLVSLDPSQKLCDAVATMIDDQHKAGGGGWRKLVARLKPSERGALVDVRVT
jgi:hypothetical protein